MKFFLPILLAGILISSSSLYPSTIKTPTDLGSWLSENFTYQLENNGEDYWKTPKETIKDKGGDCEDASILTKHILKDLNYDSIMLVITFDNKETSHAINRLKIDNNYTMFSNFVYFPKKFKTLRLMLTYYYPNWNKIYLIHEKFQHTGFLIGIR